MLHKTNERLTRTNGGEFWDEEYHLGSVALYKTEAAGHSPLHRDDLKAKIEGFMKFKA